jgi:hypothetical protein
MTGPKPDFSGDYQLNRPACALGPGAAGVLSASLRIEHQEPRVRLEARFVFAGRTFEYSLESRSDGRERPDPKDGRTVSSLRWDALVLEFIDRTEGTNAGLVMSWRYELQDGGRCLRATERIRGEGRDQDNVWVFERLSPSQSIPPGAA